MAKRRAKRNTDNASQEFWDGVADQYDDEIFNTLTADVRGELPRLITKYAKGAAVAADLGCGVGRFVPLLSRFAKTVHAADFSQESIDVADRDHGHLPNVSFQCVDLAKKSPRICRADLALSINVLVMPDREKYRAILRNTKRNVANGGHLILVVPSLETVLYTYRRMVEWHEREGLTSAAAVEDIEQEAAADIKSIVEGHVAIQDTATKHFLREEVLVLLSEFKFELIEESRVEYSWSEDYDDPPNWLSKPLPWDWLFVAKRR